ncbi:MAG: hypothetical protein ACOZAM_17660 [Pseudomonadota bacterium]
MTPDEWSLFSGFVRCARRYVEFGSGASTVLAAELAGDSVTTFDSSKHWLDRVAENCRVCATRLTPKLTFIDIGETENWGFPKGEATRARWPEYHASMWDDPAVARGDLYLVDGRFRVACFIQVMLHAGEGAFVAFHDYASRPHYHDAARIGREVVRVHDLSIFVRSEDFDPEAARNLLATYAYDPR